MPHHVVIEPHADDAFLSLGGHIKNWVKAGEEVTIVTVYSGTRKRAADAEAYARSVRAGWVGLGYVEAGSTASAAPLGDGLRLPKADRYYSPLGIKHHEHYLVTDFARMEAKNLLYYLDQPYALTQSNGEEVNFKMRGRFIQSYLRPHASKWNAIPLFKDQAKFFHFNPAEKLKACEEMVLC
jgi:hypothetical protein